MVIVSRTRLDIVYANSAARRIVHPHRLVRDRPVPDPWPDYSLPNYVRKLFDPGVSPTRQLNIGPERTYRLNGIAARRGDVAVLLLDDVTEQERHHRAEREFVANAAHELLTPLTGLVGAAHVLEAGAKEVPEDRDRFISHIAKECERLTRIARSLLVLARAQSGEEPPRLDIVRLSSALEDVTETLVGDGAQALRIACPNNITVLVDQDLFTQALSNLVTNAIRHGSGEELELRASEIEGNRVEIQVLGPGRQIPSDEVARLERRFRTGAGRDGGGFGLGLSIARQSIEAIGGRLRLDNGQGEGVLARIELASGRVAQS